MQTEFLINDLGNRNLLITGDTDTGKSVILYDLACRKLNEGKHVLVFSQNNAFRELTYFFPSQDLEEETNPNFDSESILHLISQGILSKSDSYNILTAILSEYSLHAEKANERCYIVIDDIDLVSSEIYDYIIELSATCKNLTVYVSTLDINPTKKQIIKALFPAFFLLSEPKTCLDLFDTSVKDVNFNFNGMSYAGCFCVNDLNYVIRFAFTDLTRREFGLKSREVHMLY